MESTAHEGWNLSAHVDFSEIEKANRQIGGLFKKLGQADKMFSGMHAPTKIPTTIHQMDTATASLIKRLDAEGKTYEANKQRVLGYSTAIERLNKKQENLEKNLEKIATSSGEVSAAYKRQQVRINENATAIAKYRGGIKEAQSAMDKIRPTPFQVLKSKLAETNKEAGKTHSIFKSVFSANVLSTAATSLFGKLKNGITSAFNAGKEFNEQQQTMNATWLTLTGNASKGQAMVKQINDMALAAQNSTEMVDGLSQKFYAINKSASQTGRLTKDVLTLQDAFGKSDDAVMNFGTQFSQMLANQKVSAQDMLSFVNVFPEYRSQLLKTYNQQNHTKLSMKQFNDEMSKGKVSSKIAVTALNTLSDSYKNATGNFTKTLPGMRRVIQANGKRIAGELTKPFTNMKSPFASAVSKWVSDKSTMKRFSTLGNTWATGLNNSISKALGGHNVATNTTKFLNKTLDALNSKSKKFFGWLGKHAKDIGTLTSSLITITGEVGKAAWKDFSTIIVSIGKATGLISKNSKGDTLHQLAEGAKSLSKNKTAIKLIADSIVTIATVKGIKAATNPLISLGSGALKGYKNIIKLKDAILGVGKAIKAVKNGESILSVLGEGLSKKGGLTGSIGNYMSDIASGAKLSPLAKFKSMKASGKVLGGTAGKAFGIAGTALEAGTSIYQAFKDRHSATKRSRDIGGGVGSIAVGALTSLIPVVGPMLAPVGAFVGKKAGEIGGSWVNSFTKGIQRKKPPKKFWSMENFGYSTKTFFADFASDWNSFWGKRGDDMKAFGKSSKKWFSNVGTSFNTGVKDIKKWFNDLPSNIGKTNSSIKEWAKQTGDNIHKGWNKGIKASHNFFKNLPSNTRKTLAKMKSSWSGFWNSMPRKWNSFKSKFGKGWNSFWNKSNRQAKSSWNRTKRNWNSFWGSMPKKWNTFKSSFGKSWNSFWKNTKKWASDSWNGTKRNWNNFWNTLPKKWNTFKKDFGKGWNSFWGGVKVGFDDTFGKISSAWNNFWNGAGKHLGDFAKWVGNSWTGTKNNVKAFLNDVNYARGGSQHKYKYDKMPSHAKGGKILATHGALVGEEGPELAYRPMGNARLLGVNGPEIAKVHSGERILNARDTLKVMNGGLGRGLILKGYAKGTDKPAQAVNADYKTLSNKSSQTLVKLARKSLNVWQGITKHTKGQSSKTRQEAVSNFSKMTRSIDKQTNKTNKNTVSDFTSMRKGVNSQMNKLHDGVISLGNSTSKGFGKALNKMHDYARSAMSDTIDQINKGISGIDKVLGQFGGNTSVIKPVKFATGTDANGRLTENTLAMLNDAETGPRQEAVVTEKNEIFLPQGRNTVMPLKKGWGVLNGTQTQQLGLKHFAKGSGVSHEELKKIAAKNGENPAKSFKQMFSSLLTPGKTVLSKGTNNLVQSSSAQYGVPWNNAMWTVINNAIGGATGKGGTREAFLKYAESTFAGVPYVMGAMSKVASDCSGMVAQALSHFGINAGRSTVDMQNSSALEYLGKNISKTIPGDLVIFGHGTGAAGHVGIIKNPETGTMFNETPPRARVTNVSDDMSMGYGFYRVRGLHNATSKSKTMKADNHLITLAKNQLGRSAISWIKKNLGDEGSLGGNINGDGVQRWAGTVKKILGMLHLSTSNDMVNRVLRQIQTESGGNPYARQPGADPDGDGSGPALGLMQTKRATYEAFKRKGDTSGIFNGPSNIYAGLNYAKHRYGSSLSYLGQGHGYAKGGNPPLHQKVLVGEKGPEIAEFKQPVHIYDSNESKKQLGIDNLARQVPKVIKSKPQQPVVNININGNISSESDANNVAQIIADKITDLFTRIGDEFGTDPSII
ncbi:tape measure domain-containing protein [Lactobacillus colini]|uniref:Tape measure domain-containing protein n=1 Tax=Lactobacillus colini TaxID=1819254 RepID=A0ABS4ME23_9LACO|nr:tape measure protein [Lactobacillus colini]MBP2057899.1 tape measure domain-containing protein [Lactobacillus colini]